MKARPIRNLRWYIAGLLALATALSYLDRQSFPVVVKAIERDIAISDAAFGQLHAAFLVAYASMYLVGGRLLDIIGTRKGYTIMIAWWSLANLATGLVGSVLGLGIARALLGMGEGGGFPASGKAVAEWFPPKERSLAFGLFNTGSALGSVVAAPVLTLIAAGLGWRAVFFITGGVGLTLALVWHRLYAAPGQNRRIGPDELAYISAGQVAAGDRGQGDAPQMRWRDLFRYRQVWGLMLAKALTDSAWFFLIAWLPKYLADVRGFDLKAIGQVAWIPYACAGVGSVSGGALGTWLIGRGFTLDRARKLALVVPAVLMPICLLIAVAPVALAVACFGVALFAHQFWSANVQTLAADLFPSRIVGSVEGLIGCAGAASAGVFQLLAGRLVAQHGYAAPFVFTGVVHLTSLAIILAVVGRIQPVAALWRRGA